MHGHWPGAEEEHATFLEGSASVAVRLSLPPKKEQAATQCRYRLICLLRLAACLRRLLSCKVLLANVYFNYWPVFSCSGKNDADQASRVESRSLH